MGTIKSPEAKRDRVSRIEPTHALGTMAFGVVFIAFAFPVALFVLLLLILVHDRSTAVLIPMVLLLFFVYGGSRIILAGVQSWRARSVFEAGFTTTKARVVGREQRVVRGPPSGSDGVLYYVTVQFDAAGEPVTLVADVGVDLYERAQKGRTLTVGYADADPRIALLEGERIPWRDAAGTVHDHRMRPTGRNRALALGVGLVLVGIMVSVVATAWVPWYVGASVSAVGVCFVIMGGRAGDSLHWFENTYETTKAVVLERDQDDQRYTITVRFDADGKQVTLKARVSGELYGRLEQGQTLTIWYAKADPRIALVEGEEKAVAT
jgi:hypothetical protein